MVSLFTLSPVELHHTTSNPIFLYLVNSSTFDFNIHRLEGKNIVSFGDSVTADATIGASGLTYPRLFASKYSMNFKANYAIGGTTATYMYKGSNIYKEYANNKTAIDLCAKEDANMEVVAISALLHDADDYKLFGQECADKLTNAKRIMNECGVDENTKQMKKQLLN